MSLDEEDEIDLVSSDDAFDDDDYSDDDENKKKKVNRAPATSKPKPKVASAAVAAKKKKTPKKKAVEEDDDDDEKFDPTQETDAKVGGRTESAKKALANKFEKLTPREHVLKRPDTYVGSTEHVKQPMWVLDGKRMVEREISFVPALYKIFDEILVNAADNKRRDVTMKEIRVDIDSGTGRITVRNDGKGIPVEKHTTHMIYIPELIFGHLLTGENFNDEEDRVVGGRNGYGAKLANIFSTTFKVETSDKASEQCYTQIWTDNMQVCNKAKITKSKAKDYTEVSFIPDYARFGMAGLDEDMLALMRKRVYDVAGVTDKTVKVYLNGELIPCNTFEKYVKMYTEEPTVAPAPIAPSDNGGEGGEDAPKALPTAGSPAKPKKSIIFAELNDRWQIAVTCSKDGNPTQVSFVNSICTYKGGQHVQYLQDKIVKYITDVIEKKHKQQASVIKPQQIKNHIWLFVNALVVNPSFDSQTKENLTTKPAKFGPKEYMPDLKDDVIAKIVKNTDILENVLSWASHKQMRDLKRVGGGRKKVTLMDIPKLDDANNAGGKKSQDCTLILTEGDSAKTLALSGISVVGRDDYGVFPLKGKMLNVREAAHSQIMKNTEIQNLMRIIGLKVGEKYESTKDLRYGHVMIMTDQDQDGSHIKGLVFNFFHHYFPSLLSLPGFLQVFVTPLVKVTKKERTLAFYSLREYDEWKVKTMKEAREKAVRKDPRASEEVLRTSELASLRAWRVKYYKGLGTNSSKEAQEYFAKIDSHSIQMQFDNRSGDAIDMAFSKARVEDRKSWLLKHDPERFIPVDFRAKILDYRHFVDGELVLFSLADNVRSIPSVLDGLKPSQRKVLYACLKRNLVQEIKVSQLSGYVSEHAAYHHGEESLSGTIINMAQTFVGSNNIALLHAGGAFGTRRLGGKDSASPRYIFTKIQKVTRVLFHPDDDALLKRMEDDGMLVEPKYYCPIVPLLLINGSSGIGTGWSTEIPSFNPRQVIEAVRMKLQGSTEQAPKLVPYFHGFTGDIIEEVKPKKGTSGRYLIRGRFDLVDDKLFITELPLGKWTGVYKEWLIESISVENGGTGTNTNGGGAGGKNAPTNAAVGRKTFPDGAIKEIRENHTDETVAFEITLSPEYADQLRAGGAEMILNQFQLQTTVSTSNMHAFDENGMIRKFESPEEILDVFFAYRLPMYVERKRHLEKELSKECDKLSAQARFVKMIVEGQLVLSRKSRVSVLAELQKLGFPKWFKSKAEDSENGGNAEVGATNEDETASQEGEDDEDGNDEDKSGRGYDYLLSLTFWSLTMEKFKSLEQKAREKAKELEVLRSRKPEDLWLSDLEALAQVLDEIDEEDSVTRKEQDAVRGKMKKGGGVKRRKPLTVNKKKKYSSSTSDEENLSDLVDSDDDEDDDDDFDAKVKRKKAAPTKAKKKNGAAPAFEPTKVPAPTSSKPVISSSMLPKTALAKEPKEKKETVPAFGPAASNGSASIDVVMMEASATSSSANVISSAPAEVPTVPAKKAAPKKKAPAEGAKKPAAKRAKVVRSSSEEDGSDSDFDSDGSVPRPVLPRAKRAAATKKPMIISDDDDEVEFVGETKSPASSSKENDDEFAFSPDAVPKPSQVSKQLQLKKSPDRKVPATSSYVVAPEQPPKKKSLREQFEEQLAATSTVKSSGTVAATTAAANVETVKAAAAAAAEKKPSRAATTVSRAKTKYIEDSDSLLDDDDDEEDDVSEEEDDDDSDY